jgi:4-hydroxy-4-methyl-2-oxoglutarate aldolase
MSEETTAAADQSLGTAHISDAMERMGMHRQVIVGLTLLSAWPLAVVQGPAVTIRQVPKEVSGGTRDRNLTRQREVAEVLASSGDVVIIDAGGRTDVATWGENLTLAAFARGVAGLVANGAIRDSERIRRTGFPVLCRGFAPVASRWELETAAINEEITIANVAIRPGDMLFGDADGLVVIPPANWHAVQREAQAIYREEEERRTAFSLHTRRKDPLIAAPSSTMRGARS